MKNNYTYIEKIFCNNYTLYVTIDIYIETDTSKAIETNIVKRME